VADGPRASHPGDDQLCRQVRSIISDIDWPCEVLSNFAHSNLGCEERVVSGLNWAFDEVEEAIILEDDCLPQQTFFPFCQELLARYRNDTRISAISGTNVVAPCASMEYSYYFSRLGGIWGWASWRSAWRRYDRYLDSWEAVKKNNLLREIFDRGPEAEYWAWIFDAMHNRTGPKTWDYQWFYTILINNMLSIVPSVNLVKNIGFGRHATHTQGESCFANLRTEPIAFPLKHPPYMVPMKSFDDQQQAMSLPTFKKRVRRKFNLLRIHFRPPSDHPITTGPEHLT
jgi:hypothetical protein